MLEISLLAKKLQILMVLQSIIIVIHIILTHTIYYIDSIFSVIERNEGINLTRKTKRELLIAYD